LSKTENFQHTCGGVEEDWALALLAESFAHTPEMLARSFHAFSI